jgi:hypothetical protein
LSRPSFGNFATHIATKNPATAPNGIDNTVKKSVRSTQDKLSSAPPLLHSNTVALTICITMQVATGTATTLPHMIHSRKRPVLLGGDGEGSADVMRAS